MMATIIQQDGKFGFKFRETVPTAKHRKQRKVINELEATLYKLSQCELQQPGVDSSMSIADLVHVDSVGEKILSKTTISNLSTSPNLSPGNGEEKKSKTNDEDLSRKEDVTKGNSFKSLQQQTKEHTLKNDNFDQLEVTTLPDNTLNYIQEPCITRPRDVSCEIQTSSENILSEGMAEEAYQKPDTEMQSKSSKSVSGKNVSISGMQDTENASTKAGRDGNGCKLTQVSSNNLSTLSQTSFKQKEVSSEEKLLYKETSFDESSTFEKVSSGEKLSHTEKDHACHIKPLEKTKDCKHLANSDDEKIVNTDDNCNISQHLKDNRISESSSSVPENISSELKEAPATEMVKEKVEQHWILNESYATSDSHHMVTKADCSTLPETSTNSFIHGSPTEKQFVVLPKFGDASGQTVDNLNDQTSDQMIEVSEHQSCLELSSVSHKIESKQMLGASSCDHSDDTVKQCDFRHSSGNNEPFLGKDSGVTVSTSETLSDRQEAVSILNMKEFNNEDLEQTNKTDQQECASMQLSGAIHSKLEKKISGEMAYSTDQEENGAEEVDVLYGADGYKHYKILAEIEKHIKLEELMEAKQQVFEHYRWQIKTIDEVEKLAKAYYMNPKGKAVDDWQKLKNIIIGKSSDMGKSETHVRVQLGNLPDFIPWFTYSIIMVQILTLVFICIFGGFSSVAVEPELKLMNEVKTFLGSETVHKWDVPNIWIGPNAWFFIGIGSMYAPCMRDDVNIRVSYMDKNYTSEIELGCCEVVSRNTAGTTTEAECDVLSRGTAVWKSGTVCSKRLSGQNSVAHIIKPCCVDVKGTCLLLSHEHCIFVGGVFHVTGTDHCSQVSCLKTVCKIGSLEVDEEAPWLLKNPAQWWRMFISLFYHYGIIHMLMVITVEFFLVKPIEQGIGWLRVILIYIITGTAGLMLGSLFSPYQPHVGATGALAGFLGILLIELIHFWEIVEKPRAELAKLSVALLIFFLAGTLPYINNFNTLGGFISGLLFGPLFLPYVTFGRWHKRWRWLIILTSIPLIVSSFFVLIYVFYKVQTVENCKICQWLNCVPFTNKMCNSTLWNYN